MIEILRHQFGLLSLAATQPPPWVIGAMLLFALLAANTVHAWGHALCAHLLGDPTPKTEGRVTLNPFAHLDPLGSLVFVATLLIGFPIGWSKNVRTIPENFSVGPRLGTGLVALAGPIANFALALLLAPVSRIIIDQIFRHGLTTPLLLGLLLTAITILLNLSVAVFNLLPAGPQLDATHILASLLPPGASAVYRAFMTHWGQYLFLALMASGILPALALPVIMHLFQLLVGL